MKVVSNHFDKLINEKMVLVLDFGGQYSQIIARKIRELGVYCEIEPFDLEFSEIEKKNLSGIVFSGGPSSVNCKEALKVDLRVFDLKVPVLGICYGAQLIATSFGGKVARETEGEYGETQTEFDLNCRLFKGLPSSSSTWMSHFDSIVDLPEGFQIVAKSKRGKIAAMEKNSKVFALQFHPEVSHTSFGNEIISNFLFEICGCEKNWSVEVFSKKIIENIKSVVKNEKVLLALSGGVDSCVLAALFSKAIGKNLTAVFVDNGFMRKGEVDEIKKTFSNWNMNFVVVDAAERFLARLKGVCSPEQKRKLVGEQFIRVFEEQAKKIGKVAFFAQGTIYSDFIESGFKKNSSLIKSHHNVAGLPLHVDFDYLIEPLKMFFKDEVRAIGQELNLPEQIVKRQPFPGPGLSIRILGEVNLQKLEILREADYVFREEIEKSGLNKIASQYFAVISASKSVGVKGDERSYDHIIVLRAVETFDFMTANFVRAPYDVLSKIASRIVNEVEGVNRVLYDITTKPPATIEFE